jgi:hypothetical protein
LPTSVCSLLALRNTLFFALSHACRYNPGLSSILPQASGRQPIDCTYIFGLGMLCKVVYVQKGRSLVVEEQKVFCHTSLRHINQVVNGKARVAWFLLREGVFLSKDPCYHLVPSS